MVKQDTTADPPAEEKETKNRGRQKKSKEEAAEGKKAAAAEKKAAAAEKKAAAAAEKAAAAAQKKAAAAEKKAKQPAKKKGAPKEDPALINEPSTKDTEMSKDGGSPEQLAEEKPPPKVSEKSKPIKKEKKTQSPPPPEGAKKRKAPAKKAAPKAKEPTPQATTEESMATDSVTQTTPSMSKIVYSEHTDKLTESEPPEGTIPSSLSSPGKGSCRQRARKKVKAVSSQVEEDSTNSAKVALELFQKKQGETGWKEPIEEITQKIQDTSETSDDSVQKALTDAKQVIADAEQWSSDFKATFLTPFEESPDSPLPDPQADEWKPLTVEKFKASLSKTIPLECKTKEMTTAFKIFEEHRHWMNGSEQLTSLQLRKDNGPSQLKDLKVILNDKLEAENTFGLLHVLLKNQVSALEDLESKLASFEKACSSLLKDTLDKESLPKLEELYAEQKTLSIKPKAIAYQLKHLVRLLQFSAATLKEPRKPLSLTSLESLFNKYKAQLSADTGKAIEQRLTEIRKEVEKISKKAEKTMESEKQLGQLITALEKYKQAKVELAEKVKLGLKEEFPARVDSAADYISRVTAILRKCKASLCVKLDDAADVEKWLELVRKDCLNSLAPKASEEAHLSGFASIKALKEAIQTFRIKQDLTQQVAQKLPLKKIQQLIDQAKKAGETEKAAGLQARVDKYTEWKKKYKEIQVGNDNQLRKALKTSFETLNVKSEALYAEKEEFSIDLTAEETRTLNKVKKWSSIVVQADELVNQGKGYDDIDIYSNLAAQLDVCKSLTDIEVVAKLKYELDKISKFQEELECLWDATPQDVNAIEGLLVKTKAEIKIDYAVEFKAIENQIQSSRNWDSKSKEILELPQKDQYARLADVKAYLKEVLDDDENSEMQFSLVTQEVYDQMRILLVRLLVMEFQEKKSEPLGFYNAIQDEFPSEAEDETDLSMSQGKGSPSALTKALSDGDKLKSPTKKGKISTCKKKEAADRKIKEVLRKEVLLMELAKKVHQAFFSANRTPLSNRSIPQACSSSPSKPASSKQATSKPTSKDKEESMEIDELLGDETNKQSTTKTGSILLMDSASGRSSTQKIVKPKFLLSLDEVKNLVQSRDQLPFFLKDEDFQLLKEQLTKYEEEQAQVEEKLSREERYPIGDYDEHLEALSNLKFSSPLFDRLYTLYEDCNYMMELTQQFCPDKLPVEQISKFVPYSRAPTSDDVEMQDEEDGNQKEYIMYANDFKYIQDLMEAEGGLQFLCPVSDLIRNLYTSNKARFEDCQSRFLELWEGKTIDEMTFDDLNHISKDLERIRMNFEDDEKKLKKQIWTAKAIKLVKCYCEGQDLYDTDEKRKEGKPMRFHSDYVRLAFDDSLEFGLNKKSRREESLQDLSLLGDKKACKAAASLSSKDLQYIIDKLSDILDYVDMVHKVLKSCASEEELEEVAAAEDCRVVNFHLRISSHSSDLKRDPERAKAALEDEKHVKPLQLLANMKNSLKSKKQAKDDSASATMASAMSSTEDGNVSSDDMKDDSEDDEAENDHGKKRKASPKKRARKAPEGTKADQPKKEPKKRVAKAVEKKAAPEKAPKSGLKMGGERKEKSPPPKKVKPAERPSAPPGHSKKILELKARLARNLEKKAQEAAATAEASAKQSPVTDKANSPMSEAQASSKAASPKIGLKRKSPIGGLKEKDSGPTKKLVTKTDEPEGEEGKPSDPAEAEHEPSKEVEGDEHMANEEATAQDPPEADGDEDDDKENKGDKAEAEDAQQKEDQKDLTDEEPAGDQEAAPPGGDEEMKNLEKPATHDQSDEKLDENPADQQPADNPEPAEGEVDKQEDNPPDEPKPPMEQDTAAKPEEEAPPEKPEKPAKGKGRGRQAGKSAPKKGKKAAAEESKVAEADKDDKGAKDTKEDPEPEPPKKPTKRGRKAEAEKSTNEKPDEAKPEEKKQTTKRGKKAAEKAAADAKKEDSKKAEPKKAEPKKRAPAKKKGAAAEEKKEEKKEAPAIKPKIALSKPSGGLGSSFGGGIKRPGIAGLGGGIGGGFKKIVSSGVNKFAVKSDIVDKFSSKLGVGGHEKKKADPKSEEPSQPQPNSSSQANPLKAGDDKKLSQPPEVKPTETATGDEKPAEPAKSSEPAKPSISPLKRPPGKVSPLQAQLNSMNKVEKKMQFSFTKKKAGKK